MKKIAFFVVFCAALLAIYNATFAYMVNPFYAIKSSTEYNNVKNILNGNSNQLYFQWGRITKDEHGQMVFTDKYNKSISVYDTETYYGFPGDDNLKDFRAAYPEGKALLSVFFNGSKNRDGIDFLSMNKDEWESNIIKPIVKMVNELSLDGVVLDFECFRDSYGILPSGILPSGILPSGTLPDDNIVQKTGWRENYNRFLEHIKSFLGEKYLEVCIHPTNVPGYYDGYDYEFINRISDYIILMAYDYQHGYLYNKPDVLSNKYKSIDIPETQPYPKVYDAVDKLVNQQKIKPEKLIVGISLAPVKWSKFKKCIDGSWYTYFEMNTASLSDILDINVPEEPYNKIAKISKKVLSREQAIKLFPDTYNKLGEEFQGVEYYYESPTGIYEKYQTILNKYGLAGVSVWRLGIGNTDIWSQLIKLNYEPLPTPTLTPMPASTPTPVPASTLKPAQVVVKDTTPPPVPVVNSVKSSTKIITGVAEAKSLVTVKRGNVVLGYTYAKSDRTFAITIAAQKTGTTLYITAKDTAGNTSSACKVVVTK